MYAARTKYVADAYNLSYELYRKDVTTAKKILHFAGAYHSYKPWRYRFTEDDLTRLDLPMKEKYISFVIDSTKINLAEVWWKYAQLAPNYSELLAEAEKNRENFMKLRDWIQRVNYYADKYFALLSISTKQMKSLENIIQHRVSADSIAPLDFYAEDDFPIPYQSKIWLKKRQNGYVEFLKLDNQMGKWIEFPLLYALSKGETYKLTIKIKTSATKKDIWLFIAKVTAHTQIIAHIKTEADIWQLINTTFSPNDGGYVRFALTSTSFPNSGEFFCLDYIKIDTCLPVVPPPMAGIPPSLQRPG
jgi:hypothetical protein